MMMMTMMLMMIMTMMLVFLMTMFRSFVLDRMVRAINRWDISSSRNINYRSFAPIIRWIELRKD